MPSSSTGPSPANSNSRSTARASPQVGAGRTPRRCAHRRYRGPVAFGRVHATQRGERRQRPPAIWSRCCSATRREADRRVDSVDRLVSPTGHTGSRGIRRRAGQTADDPPVHRRTGQRRARPGTHPRRPEGSLSGFHPGLPLPGPRKRRRPGPVRVDFHLRRSRPRHCPEGDVDAQGAVVDRPDVLQECLFGALLRARQACRCER